MSDETTNPMREAIQEAISENPVILFMKGNPEAPACGFSARTVAMLQSLGTRFAAVDILPDPRIRQELESGELAETLGIQDAEPAAPVIQDSAPMTIENRL
jgi:monothiol glutaredoxin